MPILHAIQTWTESSGMVAPTAWDEVPGWLTYPEDDWAPSPRSGRGYVPTRGGCLANVRGDLTASPAGPGESGRYAGQSLDGHRTLWRR